MRWLLRDGFVAAVERMKREALADWKFRTSLWAQGVRWGGSERAPELPTILKQG